MKGWDRMGTWCHSTDFTSLIIALHFNKFRLLYVVPYCVELEASV